MTQLALTSVWTTQLLNTASNSISVTKWRTLCAIFALEFPSCYCVARTSASSPGTPFCADFTSGPLLATDASPGSDGDLDNLHDDTTPFPPELLSTALLSLNWVKPAGSTYGMVWTFCSSSGDSGRCTSTYLMPFGSIEYFIGSLITPDRRACADLEQQRFDVRRVHAEYTQNSLAGLRCPARWCHGSDTSPFPCARRSAKRPNGLFGPAGTTGGNVMPRPESVYGCPRRVRYDSGFSAQPGFPLPAFPALQTDTNREYLNNILSRREVIQTQFRQIHNNAFA